MGVKRRVHGERDTRHTDVKTYEQTRRQATHGHTDAENGGQSKAHLKPIVKPITINKQQTLESCQTGDFDRWLIIGGTLY